MSITNYDFILFLFLLCLSLHACNARRDLGLFGHKNKNQHKPHSFHFSTKVQIENKDSVMANEISVSKKKLGAQTNVLECTQTEEKLTRNEDCYKNKDKSSNNKAIFKGKESEFAKMNMKNKSQVSVSWRVPHKKRGEKQPGFNLDYSPPKTHPPSHN